MPYIFISYRREDTAGHTGRLFDRLSERFGQDQIFRDIDTIEPGVDFVQVVDAAVGSCDVLLAVIGKNWLNATDSHGRRRLDNPEDFVRLEIATALKRNIRTIPILVMGASMPSSEELPEPLVPLARRNALELSDGRWAFDVGRLIQTLEHVLGEPHAEAVHEPSEATEIPPVVNMQSAPAQQPGNVQQRVTPNRAAAATSAAAGRRNTPRLWGAVGAVMVILMVVGVLMLYSARYRGTTTATPTVVSRPTTQAAQVALVTTESTSNGVRTQATTAPTLIPTPMPTPTAPPTATPPTPLPSAPPVPTTQPVAPLPIKVSTVTASRTAAPGKDACGNLNTYGPEKAIDGQRNTAWRVDSDGAGESIQLRFAAPIKVARVGIIASFDKIDPCDGTDRFFQGRIVRKARLNFDAGQSFDVALDRVRQIQYFDLPDVPSQQLQITILATDPPPANNGRNLTSISEIEVWGRP